MCGSVLDLHGSMIDLCASVICVCASVIYLSASVALCLPVDSTKKWQPRYCIAIVISSLVVVGLKGNVRSASHSLDVGVWCLVFGGEGVSG